MKLLTNGQIIMAMFWLLILLASLKKFGRARVWLLIAASIFGLGYLGQAIGESKNPERPSFLNKHPWE